jgi:hypothetical protein
MMPAKSHTLTVLGSYPTVWRAMTDSDSEGVECPFQMDAMVEYLTDCHDKYSRAVHAAKFTKFALRTKRVFANRVFWVWSCQEHHGSTWHILVGRGESTKPDSTRNEAFMYAQEYAEDYDPLLIIIKEFPEYDGQTGKLQ